MSQATSILPIQGVPDELIRVLNARFREISGAASPAAANGVPGLFFGTKTRPDANGTAVGTFGTDTDTGLVYQVRTVSSRQSWCYASGQVRATFANKPTPGGDDTGLLWSVTDYAHLLRWTGTGWEFADGCGNYIVGFTAAPTGNGYQLCDGTATAYLKIAAGVATAQAFTTPNLTGSPAYLKWAAAYSGPAITAGSGPSVSVAGRGTGGSSAITAVGNGDSEPAHLNLLPYFRR